MKNFFILTASVICLAITISVFSACGVNSVSPVTDGTEYNENIKYKLYYTSDEESRDGKNISESDLHDNLGFYNDYFYMTVDFTVSSFDAEGWDKNFNLEIDIYPYTNAFVIESENAEIQENDNYSNVNLLYSIPIIKNEHSYRVVIKVSPINCDDWLAAKIAFFGDGESLNNVKFSEEIIILNFSTNLKYSLNEDGCSYSVIGDGDEYTFCFVIPSEYEGLPVTEIKSWGFRNYGMLCAVYMPDSIQKIGYGAFEDCSGLIDIRMSEGLTEIYDRAFEYCSSLKNCSIPDSVTEIGEYAFACCDKLENIVIPESVKRIGNNAFYKTAYYNNDENWDSCALYIGDCLITAKSNFSGSYTVRQGTRLISSYAFNYCYYLEEITIPASVTHIGQYAFQDCDRLDRAVFEKKSGWKLYSFTLGTTLMDSLDVSEPEFAAEYLRWEEYYVCEWICD